MHQQSGIHQMDIVTGRNLYGAARVIRKRKTLTVDLEEYFRTDASFTSLESNSPTFLKSIGFEQSDSALYVDYTVPQQKIGNHSRNTGERT